MTSGFWRRLIALTRKETRELLRDSSSLALGVVLPLVLILIIGYGMSLDVKQVPTAVVLEDSSPFARQAVHFTQGSEYFAPVFVSSLAARRAAGLLGALCRGPGRTAGHPQWHGGDDGHEYAGLL